jgi:hypothetical protein
MPWFSVKKGSVGVHVTYGHGGTDLLMEDCAVRPGDPFDMRLDMGTNLRTRNKQENSYIDAEDLSNNMESLKSIQINDDTILRGVSNHMERILRTQGKPERVRVCVVLKGEHWFDAALSIPDEFTLMLDGLSPAKPD